MPWLPPRDAKPFKPRHKHQALRTRNSTHQIRIVQAPRKMHMGAQLQPRCRQVVAPHRHTDHHQVPASPERAVRFKRRHQPFYILPRVQGPDENEKRTSFRKRPSRPLAPFETCRLERLVRGIRKHFDGAFIQSVGRRQIMTAVLRDGPEDVRALCEAGEFGLVVVPPSLRQVPQDGAQNSSRG